MSGGEGLERARDGRSAKRRFALNAPTSAHVWRRGARASTTTLVVRPTEREDRGGVVGRGSGREICAAGRTTNPESRPRPGGVAAISAAGAEACPRRRDLSTAGARCAEAAAEISARIAARWKPRDAVAVVAIGRRGTRDPPAPSNADERDALRRRPRHAAAAGRRRRGDGRRRRARQDTWLVPAANASAAAVLVCAASAPALVQELEVEEFAIS